MLTILYALVTLAAAAVLSLTLWFLLTWEPDLHLPRPKEPKVGGWPCEPTRWE